MCISESFTVFTKLGEKLISVFHSNSASKKETKQEERLKIKADIASATQHVTHFANASDVAIKIEALEAISPLLTCEIAGVRIAAGELHKCIDSEDGFEPNKARIKYQLDKFTDECNKALYGTRKTSSKA